MTKQNAKIVSAQGRKTNLMIMDVHKDQIPSTFALLGTSAGKKVAIRITGGCKGMSDDDKQEMLDFFSREFKGYSGLLWSGGTRSVNKDGTLDPMVTDIPGLIANQNPTCVALGTTPRTDNLSLQGESTLVLDESGTIPNPSMSGILLIQDGPEKGMDWDGDLDIYFQMMDNWKKYAAFEAIGTISWNGGGITRKEIERSIKNGWPTIVISGTGRASDDIANELKEGTLEVPDNHQLITVNKNTDGELRNKLIEFGFIDED